MNTVSGDLYGGKFVNTGRDTYTAHPVSVSFKSNAVGNPRSNTTSIVEDVVARARISRLAPTAFKRSSSVMLGS